MEIILKDKIKEAVRVLYNSEVTNNLIQLQETRREFKGDFTLVLFPLLRFSKNTPEKTGESIGNYLLTCFPSVACLRVHDVLSARFRLMSIVDRYARQIV